MLILMYKKGESALELIDSGLETPNLLKEITKEIVSHYGYHIIPV